ncbi:hypothetical protein YC2023_049573 [Brassica napus]
MSWALGFESAECIVFDVRSAWSELFIYTVNFFTQAGKEHILSGAISRQGSQSFRSQTKLQRHE